MTLDEIFKTKPELLKETEVLSLIAYVDLRNKQLIEIVKSGNEFYDRVLEICVHSDVILISGKKSHESIVEILNLIENGK